MDSTQTNRRRICLWGGAIAIATAAAYANTFRAPFVFDDLGTIVHNGTIRHLWPVWIPLSPPREGMPVTGRPVANLSFALNFALGGLKLPGYHAANLLIHILAALALFGILRRTLARLLPEPASLGAAFVAALVWALHPLQTESVTYLSQRVESLMGLFYLLTLYCFIRFSAGSSFVPHGGTTADEKAGRWGWGLLSMGACLFGMATKEVMATAPVVIFLYDRTFVAGSFAAAWRARRRYYLCLAGTWILLAALLWQTGDRGGTAGFQSDIAWGDYVLTQFRAVAHYLRLSLWPHPLVFFYGSAVGAPPAQLAWDAALVTALVAASGWLLARSAPRARAAGFAGAWFFLILAPSSSIVPVATETIAEHRMYLPLAALVAAGAVVLYSALSSRFALGLGLALAAVCALGTVRRDAVYRSDLGLWSATVARFPGNEVAQYNLGIMLARAGRRPEAIAHYREAVRLKPDYVEARNNLGRTLADDGQWAAAIGEYEKVLALHPELATTQFNLGDALMHEGRLEEAIEHYEAAVRLDPERPDATFNLAQALARADRLPEALAAYEADLRLAPDSAGVRNAYGVALARSGRLAEAVAQFDRASRLDPKAAEAHENLAKVLAQSGDAGRAAGEFAAAVRLMPDDPELRNNLGVALAQIGRFGEARLQFEAALRLNPGDAAVRANLARLPTAGPSP